MKEEGSKKSMAMNDTTRLQTDDGACERDNRVVFDDTGTNTEIITVEIFSTPHGTPSFNRNGGSMTWNGSGGVPPLSSNSLIWDSNSIQLSHGGPIGLNSNCGPSNVNGEPFHSNSGPFNSNGEPSDSNGGPLNPNCGNSYSNGEQFNSNGGPFNSNGEPSDSNGGPLNPNCGNSYSNGEQFNSNGEQFNSNGGPSDSNGVDLESSNLNYDIPMSSISNGVPLVGSEISTVNTYVCINSNGEALIGRDDRESKVVVENGKIIIKSEREEKDFQDLEEEDPSFIEIKGQDADDVDLTNVKSEFPSLDENLPKETPDIRPRKKSKFSCHLCDKSFISKKGFVNHLASHGNESHECNICKKSYKSEELLKNHIKCHDGTKRFQCEFCDKTYRQSTSLQQHYSVHSGEKTFFCDLCDQTFNYLTNFIRHKRRHEGKIYKCDICDKTFVEETSIYRHNKLHNGEKEHECDVCGKLFFRAGNMREHRKTHEPREKKEKIFECEQCNKVYPYRSSLRKHYVKKHGESLPDLSGNVEWI